MRRTHLKMKSPFWTFRTLLFLAEVFSLVFSASCEKDETCRVPAALPLV